jgi:hypothetical protein
MIVVLALTGCGGVVRNAHTYEQELTFMAGASSVLAQEQLEQASAAARVGDSVRCEKLAEDALTASVRVPYHLAMALFLAEVRDVDPGPPPPVPVASEWCAGERGKSVSR